ncbi:uncharacterized protein EI90DRAFT_3018347 [Cantharellus anzutake]|uniref:uncharacterized protein n=1 Tax=Cantharellus anzutake TaxID=1750568 RepID=UPI0019078EBF|nr:uncharacterized protein EI90DRAFT_3018347 [Cantharellus anzutake]KAF8326962.1 hypothetical protein EI90DRAFT_3018347 [Cantharellus anzutake]
MYHVSMLMMWKPWQGKEDLKQREQTWERAYAEFEESQPGMERIASNMQYRYECKDAADRDQDYARQFSGRQGNEGGNVESDEEDGEDDREEEGGNTRIEGQSMDEGDERELRRSIATCKLTEEVLHARQAVEIAR